MKQKTLSSLFALHYPIAKRRILCLSAALFTIHCSLFISRVAAQDISSIAKSDPLIITGAVGTNNTYYHSSIGEGYASPLSNSIYLNLNISVYGFSMPFSVYYSNDNTTFNYPHLSFNLSPHYKNWTGYFGLGSMSYSQYVMSMSFNGVGVEYDNNKLRFGVWYGRLRSAVNDNPEDPAARTPQYKRMGWGAKVGYGSNKNFIDLYFLRAYDRLKSIDERWQMRLAPQENLVFGLKGQVQPFNFFSLSANAAASVFSTDTRAEVVPEDVYDNNWNKLFDVRYTSMARFAGDVNANFFFPKVSAQLFYRMVQPDYTSLGAYYMSNNYQGYGINLATTVIPNLSLSGSFSLQSDNLSKKQLYTTNGLVYTANASTRLGEHFNVTASYNGYTQVQSDGAARVNDTTKVNRQMQSLTLTPSASFDNESLSHNIALSASLTDNKDRNKFATGQSDVTSLALGLSYSLGVKSWNMDFTGSLNHQESKGYQSKYITNIASLTTGRSFLKDNNLSVSATLNLIYNEVKAMSKSMSMGADIVVGYTLAKAHVFSLMAGMNKYGDVNVTKRRSGLDATDITASLNYSYTFSLLELKKKKPASDPSQEGGK